MTTADYGPEVKPVSFAPCHDEYRFFEHGGDWIICCRRCAARWIVRVHSEVSHANNLFLLNHARTHRMDGDKPRTA